jgi:hypothetical protein
MPASETHSPYGYGTYPNATAITVEVQALSLGKLSFNESIDRLAVDPIVRKD